MMNVIDEIAAERRRQMEAEGWTLEHDDGHRRGQMAAAAGAYAWFASLSDEDRAYGAKWQSEVHSIVRRIFPCWGTAFGGWDLQQWWKPKDRRRDLVRAGALIIAEIERLDRRAALTPTVQP